MVKWGVETLEGVSLGAVGYMLRDCDGVRLKAWMMESEGRSKLGIVMNLMEGGCGVRCVQVAWKELRQIMAKLRDGTAELMVETGRWIGPKREDRICDRCGLREWRMLSTLC